MSKRLRTSALTRSLTRSLMSMARGMARTGVRSAARAAKATRAPSVTPRRPAAAAGQWLGGQVVGAAGIRRYRLYRPPGVRPDERLPLLVMLHGCGQDATGFAASTRMNRVALRERFLVLYPEQSTAANRQGCWNWFDTDSGRAQREADLIARAVQQVGLTQPVDAARMAVAGLSAGASMAALVVTRHSRLFKAVVMHSGVPPGAAHSTLSALSAMQGRRTQPAAVSLPAAGQAPWPPLLVIQGDADTVVSPRNAQAAAQLWAQAGGATAVGSRSVQRGKRHPMSVTDYLSDGCLRVTLVDVAGLGHAWSGGAASQPFSDGKGPDASRMVWAFAARQFPAGSGSGSVR